jgi:hypothetical protein
MIRTICAALCFLTVSAVAQEIECTVQVNYEGVSTTNKDLLRDFSSDISNYINNYQWGQDKLEQKVRCTVNIFVQSVVGENRYLAQVFVGSQRPIYGSNKSTAVLRLLDDTWEFTYLRDRPINHNPYSYSDLARFLDFYMYLVLGYDYDTYESLSGKPWFQKASDVARLGLSSGSRGWQPTTTGYSRGQMINDVLNPTLEPIRKASYVYHFTGLDSLASNPQRGYANILAALEMIAMTRKSSDPRNLVIKTFFETKYMEIADIFQGYPDPAVYVMLGRLDPTHQVTYEEYRKKR